MAATTISPSTTFDQSVFCSHYQNRFGTPVPATCFTAKVQKRALFRCSAKKKIGFFDQILDYIEGGPKLRKWYGAPDILPKDGSMDEDGDEYPDDETRDAVLVTNGDTEMGQMILLSLITRQARVKAIVKDKRTAREAYGNYVEPLAGDTTDQRFVNKVLRGVSTIICPNEGFLSSVESLTGIKHIILLSQSLQLSVYRNRSGVQAFMKKTARELAEKDESVLKSTGIPYTIIRAGLLEDTPGGTQGFSFQDGGSGSGSLSREDAAFICVQAIDVLPKEGFTFEVVNGEEKVSDWRECLSRLMETCESDYPAN